MVPSKQAMKIVARSPEKMTQKRLTEMLFKYGVGGSVRRDPRDVAWPRSGASSDAS